MNISSTILLVSEVLLALMVISIVFVILMENRRPVKTMSWILVLIFIPVIGILFYFFFGQEHRKKNKLLRKMYKGLNKQHSPLLKIENSDQYSGEYNKLTEMFQNINDARLLSGNKVDFYTSGEQKFKHMFADIENATHHIHLLYYKIYDDKISNKLKDLLIKKARQGVKVRLIYDDVGSIKTKRKFFEEMKKEGIEIEAFLEVKIPWIAQRINYRNHRKIVVIDGKTGYTGGMNVGDCYVDGLSWGKWKDIQIRIEGNGVKGLQKVFLYDWYYSHKSLPQLSEYFPEMPDSKDNPMQIVSSGPTDTYKSIEKGIFQSINGAKESIYIQTPYFMPSEIILSALQTAAISNVQVHIMLPYKSDSYFVDRATHSYIKDLLEYGIHVYLYKGGFLHTKSMIIDDSLLSIGSANMDTRSFELSFETNAFIYDKKSALKAKNIFHEDMLESETVEKKHWRKRPIGRRFMESVMRLFTPLF